MFRQLAEEDAASDGFAVDSAGTGGWHVGEPPDPRSVQVARRHGVELQGTARAVAHSDFSSFDLIVAMDRANLHDLESMPGHANGSAALRLLREFDTYEGSGEHHLDVPDPYYGGPDGFQTVFDIVHRSCRNLLDHLREDLGR